MRYYLDTSVALRAIHNVPEKTRIRVWINSLPRGCLVSSRLLKTEMIRTLRRDARPLAEADPVLSRVWLTELTEAIVTVAEAIEPHVKTLDALHLATALTIGEPITVATHDRSMLQAAKILGLPTHDPAV